MILKFIGDLPGLKKWDWDTFIDGAYADPLIEAARIRSLEIGRDFPSMDGSWCSEEGIRKMREIALSLVDEQGSGS